MSPEPKSVVRIRIVHKINNNHMSLSRLPGFMSADVLSRVFPQLLACSVTFSPRLFPTIMVLFNLAHRMEHFPKFFGFILWAHRQLLESWGKTCKLIGAQKCDRPKVLPLRFITCFSLCIGVSGDSSHVSPSHGSPQCTMVVVITLAHYEKPLGRSLVIF